MRKQELIHLHALCELLRAELEDADEVPPGAFRTYDEAGVHPTDVYRRKDAHKEAIFRLLDGFDAAVREPRPEAPGRAP